MDDHHCEHEHQGKWRFGRLVSGHLSGASAFIVDFNASGAPGQAAFSTDFPGKVLPIELEAGQSVIMHKHVLCARRALRWIYSSHVNWELVFFRGEGFILQKLTGPGMTFAELDGDAVEYILKPGELMKVEPGHVAMFEGSVSFDIQMIKGIVNVLAGGEGVFLATLTGPGRIGCTQ